MGGTLNLAKESFDLCEYLENPPTESEQEYIENSKYFTTIKDALWCNCCIDLAKLYDHNPKNDIVRKNGSYAKIFNFLSMLNALKNGKYPIEIDSIVIESWIEKINDNNNSINLLKEFRDKAYAHTEIHVFPEINFHELFRNIKLLFELAFNVFNFLWCEVLGRKISDLGFTVFNPSDFDLIRKLSECQ
ncbi:hypothetical protein SNE26_28675 [Mucilaginibacter sp. cycad4]|uniref:AbiU2 domain-containing protein n=1 Tax=Mucilaginibacter sp. cycad4 TaxID=3342096 RepID=UPI002AAB7387|nr:hypothetical protein [Mucilaginibacter gossypii]WPU99989.1 hypothetical protein SNE26_28675 [Mucilaginibacter gossypii]